VNRGLDNWQCSVGLNLNTTVVWHATRVVSIIDKQVWRCRAHIFPDVIFYLDDVYVHA